MPTKNTEHAKIYIPENERERIALESLAEKGIVDYYDGGYFITDEAVKKTLKKLKNQRNCKKK